MPSSKYREGYVLQLSIKPLVFRHLPKAVVLLFVALLFACGSSATSTPASSSSTTSPTAVPQATSAPPTSAPAQPTAVPTAAVQATKAPPAAVKPTGTINYGVVETGVFQGHPRFISPPGYQYVSLTAGESLVTIMEDFSPAPFLAAEWSISADFLVWTWKIRPGSRPAGRSRRTTSSSSPASRRYTASFTPARARGSSGTSGI